MFGWGKEAVALRGRHDIDNQIDIPIVSHVILVGISLPVTIVHDAYLKDTDLDL